MPELETGLLGAALGLYTRKVSYLAAAVEGAPRVDLDGQAAGSVTSDQHAYAQRRLVHLREKANPQPKVQAKPKAPTRPKAEPRPAAPPAEPQSSSLKTEIITALAKLRAAIAARKANEAR
jgi:sRNA-binding protein